MHPPSPQLRRRGFLGLVLSYAIIIRLSPLGAAQLMNPDVMNPEVQAWFGSQPLERLNETCVLLDQKERASDDGRVEDATAAAAAPTVNRTSTVYLTMSLNRYIVAEAPGQASPGSLSHEYSYVSVVTSWADLPPATPTSWPYELTHTVKVDRFPVERTIYNNLHASPCPSVTAGKPSLDQVWHSTFIHYQADPDRYMPAGVTVPPSIATAEAAVDPAGEVDEADGDGDFDGDGSSPPSNARLAPAAAAAAVAECSEDLEMSDDMMDPECVAGGWEDTACLGQCPEVDGEIVCTRQFISSSNWPDRAYDDEDRVWAIGAFGRACWTPGERGYKLLNKPCLRGDHWLGCAPGKGYDYDWLPTGHDNSDLES